jgi:glycosyltransferase involved in cell wall biosynthesis
MFGQQGIEDAPTLRGISGYRYIALGQRFVTKFAERRSYKRSVTGDLVNNLSFPAYIHKLHRSVAAAHSRQTYDALVFLDIPALFRLEGLPVVAWLQGSLPEEAKAFRRSKRMVIAATGWRRYAMYSNYYRLDRLWTRLTTIDADLTICGSRWTQNSLVSYGHDPEKVAVLPYPIDFEQFALRDKEDAIGPRLLHLGRCDPRKRIDLLVDAFRLVRRRLPTAELMAVGRPGIVPGIIDLFAAPDLAGYVTYKSNVPRHRVPDLLGQADVLVQTSESENFGSAAAEALACGVPVVVGVTNGTADYLDPGSAIFPNYSADSVASAILDVLDQTANGEHRASRRAHAMRLLSPASVADRFESLLKKTLLAFSLGSRSM